ncbi:ETX/MTX2 family pore-forming toxin [Bacillus mycoides]|uniref:ETX/MTX2 family pore-forming toxin n=1 Tax=Bacillus mycoides TaxID=1405 RepID=UPI003D236B49
MKIVNIKKAAPIALLSTMVLFSSSPAFAATQSVTDIKMQQGQGTTPTTRVAVTKDQIKKDLADFLFYYLVENQKSTDGTNFGYTYQKLLQKWNLQFENIQSNIKLPTPTNLIYTDDYLDIASFTNKTAQDQEYLTESKTEKFSDTFSYTNAEGTKIGLSSETKLGIGIPFVAEGGEKITLSTEFTYNHSETNATTHEVSYTYPSQKLKCKPGYKTTLQARIQKGTFSGTSDIDTGILNTQELVDILAKGGALSQQKQRPNASTFVYDMYKAGMNFGLQLPSYVTLDDKTKTVVFGKSTIQYEGIAGHFLEAEMSEQSLGKTLFVKVEPLDASKKTVTMSLADYKNPTIQEKLLKQ